MALHTQLPIYRTGLELMALANASQEQRAHNLRSAWREQYHWTEWRDEWLAQATVLLEYVREEAAA